MILLDLTCVTHDVFQSILLDVYGLNLHTEKLLELVEMKEQDCQTGFGKRRKINLIVKVKLNNCMHMM